MGKLEGIAGDTVGIDYTKQVIDEGNVLQLFKLYKAVISCTDLLGSVSA